jgi:hypothetical protein
MLKVIPKKAWSYGFSVMDGAQPVAGTADRSWWGDKGEFQVQGASYTVHREKSRYVLESAGRVLAGAERPRRLFRELVIEHSGHKYTLRAKSVFRREFQLFERATYLGSIAPEGLFSRKAAVDLPAELPLYLQVFLMWLVMTFWQEADSIAVTSSVVASIAASTG